MITLQSTTSPSQHTSSPRLSWVCFNRLNKLHQGVEEGRNTGNGGGRVHVGSAGAGLAATTGAGAIAGGTGLAAGGGGVLLAGLAVVLALDDLVLLQLVKGLAVKVTAGALHVEATLDIIERLEVKPGGC